MMIIYFILASIFKAVADTLAHHYDTSVFKWWDKRFWDPSISWQYSGYLKIWFIKTKYHRDGWHLANSGMIICFCLAFCLHESLTHYWFEPLVTFFLSGILFNVVFNIFYNKILCTPS